MNKIVVSIYQDHEMSFTHDGWFNATLAAEKFGKRIDNWVRLDETKEYIAALCQFDNPSHLRDLDIRNSGYVKTKRGKNGGTWLHPDLAVFFARWLDIRFSIWCDRQIRSIISGDHPYYEWHKLRHEAASSFKVMSAVLKMSREAKGKESKQHHYMIEAKLVNWALTGEFKGLDRELLSAFELDILAKLEEQNSVLLGCGLEYKVRKQALETFANNYQLALTQEVA